MKLGSNLGSLLSKIHKMVKSNGTLFTVKYLKQARLHVTRTLAGQPLLLSPIRVSLDKQGFPIIFKNFKGLVTTLQGKKLLLTLVNISRTLRPGKSEVIPVSTASITDPYKGKGFQIPDSFITSFVATFGLAQPVPGFSQEQIKLISKAGPNGPQTLTSQFTLRY